MPKTTYTLNFLRINVSRLCSVQDFECKLLSSMSPGQAYGICVEAA